MLKKAKKVEKDQSPVSSEITEEEKSLLVSGPAVRDEKTIIGEYITIDGSISGEEHLVIEGSMKGTVSLKKHNFAIGSKGRFEGEIHAQKVSISGEMNGSIKAEDKVRITKEADFIGEIRAKSISVEDGAYFKGSIELEREPNRKPAVKEKAQALTSPQPDKEPDSLAEKEAKQGN
ncbi:MAG: polymer-forming cytoskeletal protein [Desulfobacterales bacterium]|nr:MAG: polymer-forming cytoskeletal protein [Desulfobacterales bacterium]